MHLKVSFQYSFRSEMIPSWFIDTIKFLVMSLNCTGPDRKKIKLTSSHVSHLLIITDSPKILLGITREACSYNPVFDSSHFILIVFSVLYVYSPSCLFLFMLVRSLSWNMLILWRLGCRKVSFAKRLRSHGHFASFDNMKVDRTILIPLGEG